MSISFQCSKCGKNYRLDNKLSGRRAKCACGWVMVVPQKESAESRSADFSNNASPPKSIEHAPSTTEHNSASDFNQTEEARNSQERKSKGAPIDINYKETIPWYLLLIVIGYIVFAIHGILVLCTASSYYYLNNIVSVLAIIIPTIGSIVMAVGLLQRVRLVRQLFFSAAIIWFVVISFPSFNLFYEPRDRDAWILLISFVVIPLPLLFAVNTKRSIRYFGLYCPRCGSYKVRAADSLYRKVRCKDCATVTEPWNG